MAIDSSTLLYGGDPTYLCGGIVTAMGLYALYLAFSPYFRSEKVVHHGVSSKYDVPANFDCPQKKATI
jgi:hypothetical protein